MRDAVDKYLEAISEAAEAAAWIADIIEGPGRVSSHFLF
jgi:hypothetical protein